MGKKIVVVFGVFSLILFSVFPEINAHTIYRMQDSIVVKKTILDTIRQKNKSLKVRKDSIVIISTDAVKMKAVKDSIANTMEKTIIKKNNKTDTILKSKPITLLKINTVDSIIGVSKIDSLGNVIPDSIEAIVPDLEIGDKINLDSLRAVEESNELARIDSLKEYRMLLDSLRLVKLIKKREEAVKKREEYIANLPSDLYRMYYADTYDADSISDTAIYVYPKATEKNSYRLFLPLMFYDDVPTDEELISQDSISQYSWNKVVLRNMYREYPELIRYSKKYIEELPEYRDYISIENEKKTEAKITNLFKPEIAPENIVDKDVDIHKPNFWKYLGEGSLQFSQNYISKNWYKGGENANRFLGSLKLQANYNDKQKIEWENMFEANLGYATVPSDTVHQYNVSKNLIRFTSKFGVQASKHWYYTLNSELSTQLVRNYKKNTDDLISAFMSPADFIISIGMDYKLEKKKYNLSVAILPASWNYRWVTTEEIDKKKYGLKVNESHLSTVGSTLKSTLSWQILPYIKLDSRFNYFTNYQKVEVSWENTFNLILNKHLSTKLFVHGRFNDGIKKVSNTYFQLNELLSFGINYQW